MMALPSDEFLLSAFARGDRDAFDRLTARYSGVLDSYFRRRLPDDGRVEELRQETLLALYSLLSGKGTISVASLLDRLSEARLLPAVREAGHRPAGRAAGRRAGRRGV